jgi:hypothetical protein
MFEAAQSTASTSFASRPAALSASLAALTPISAITDSSVSGRSDQRGVMISGSSSGALLITWRDFIPLAFSMNSAELV